MIFGKKCQMTLCIPCWPKFSPICNTFQVINDLVLSKNLKVAITQLCNEPQVWNFTML